MRSLLIIYAEDGNVESVKDQYPETEYGLYLGTKTQNETEVELYLRGKRESGITDKDKPFTTPVILDDDDNLIMRRDIPLAMFE